MLWGYWSVYRKIAACYTALAWIAVTVGMITGLYGKTWYNRLGVIAFVIVPLGITFLYVVGYFV